ncbi:hypothetical protein CHARACLAT_022246 [Characodon lateralis]|uniref:Uncharacterized protein n=1 Tax=Characodon lateralis TaxID=208331 RepID=A0ABU7DIT9_9TELE|nr:hypothetical protein [Characodon lateralis]
MWKGEMKVLDDQLSVTGSSSWFCDNHRSYYQTQVKETLLHPSVCLWISEARNFKKESPTSDLRRKWGQHEAVQKCFLQSSTHSGWICNLNLKGRVANTDVLLSHTSFAPTAQGLETDLSAPAWRCPAPSLQCYEKYCRDPES